MNDKPLQGRMFLARRFLQEYIAVFLGFLTAQENGICEHSSSNAAVPYKAADYSTQAGADDW